MPQPTIFDISRPGRRCGRLPKADVPGPAAVEALPAKYLRAGLPLPEVSELQLVRHFTLLSQENLSIDTAFYPLGSCTMKYNPKVNEEAARLPGLAQIHPYQPVETVQGALELMWELERWLAEISGMDAVTLQPAAGAHGEFTGVLTVRAYHQSRGDTRRTKVLIPDSAHGTNPATAKMAGFEVVTIESDRRGDISLDALKAALGDDTAGLMITIPSTLGLFDENLLAVIDAVHQAGGLVYCDGANMNAMLGQVRFGDLGVDVVHFNLHKTFSTPHGGGGPPAGPVGVKKHLESFLPIPRVVRNESSDGSARYRFDYDRPNSVGRMRSFYGNFGILVRAYTYLLSLGNDGLSEIGANAVLNANYLLSKLGDAYDVPYDRRCMHEFVLSARRQKKYGVRALHIAKRLIDYGFHPPTIYFPLIVDECLMIEPTETEVKETLDQFAEAMLAIAREAESDPELVKNAPHTTQLNRLDEVAAVRRPNLRWRRPAQGA